MRCVLKMGGIWWVVRPALHGATSADFKSYIFSGARGSGAAVTKSRFCTELTNDRKKESI